MQNKTLSDEIVNLKTDKYSDSHVLGVSKVRKFIKDLKKEFDNKETFQLDASKFNEEQKEIVEAMLKVINDFDRNWFNKIDELAGEELT